MTVTPHEAHDVEAIVSMPIPAGALPLVAEALDRYYKSRAAASPSSEERIRVDGSNKDWSEAEIKQLFLMFRNPKGRAVLRTIAQAAEGSVTYEQMAEAGGLSFDQLRAQLAWFSKYAKKLRGENIWPMTVTEDATKPKGERYVYRMPKRIAEWWLAADEDADQ